MSNNEEEVDLFDLSVQLPESEHGSVGVETNVLSIDFDASERKVSAPLPIAPQPMPSIAGAPDGDPKLDLDFDVEDFCPPSPESRADGVDEEMDLFEAAEAAYETAIVEKIELDPEPITAVSEEHVAETAFDDEFDFEVTVAEDEPTVDDGSVFGDVVADAEFDLATVAPVSVANDEREFEATAADDDEVDFEMVAAPAPEPLPPPVFNKIAHVCLNVKNLDRTVAYYENIGFKRRFAFNKNGCLFGIYLEFGNGNFVEVFEDSNIDLDQPQHRLAHFCLETDDLDAVMRSLDSRGIEYTPKKLGCDGTYQIWLKDPDGNKFEVHQYTSDSSQLIGKDVDADW